MHLLALLVKNVCFYYFTEKDKTTEEVRTHLEQLVEAYIDEGIATVSLARLFDNPQCK